MTAALEEPGQRSRPASDGFVLRTSPAGRFVRTSPAFNVRIDSGELSSDDETWLAAHGFDDPGRLHRLAATFSAAQRRAVPAALDYLILVPTLRCNLSCTYCQVSRADIGALGFDWSSDTLAAVRKLVSGLTGAAAKVEFQGGEPTLRPDLLREIIAAAPSSCDVTYVICTNLERLDDEILAIFDRDDVQISTSLDGSELTHRRQRHYRKPSASRFWVNLDKLLARYGPGKISALPTIDPRRPPPSEELIEAYAERGFTNIYLRPINYQGFARKRHAYSQAQDDLWRDYHAAFIDALIARNWARRGHGAVMEESYFGHLLRRIFRPGQNRHVDLRNPNPVGRDYVVIDYDGRAYPTDEARMLSRSGVIDLSIGDVASGWDTPQRAALEAAATNDGDPDCESCVYKPYCGRDVIDDIARYGTIDLPRRETEFCRRHLHLFDLAFSLIYSADEAVQYSLRRWLGLSGEAAMLGATR